MLVNEKLSISSFPVKVDKESDYKLTSELSSKQRKNK